MIGLAFKMEGVPEVKSGSMKGFVVLTRHKDSRETVFYAYYLNALPLEYEDGCDEKRGCQKDDEHPDGCPTTGWFYDESNFEYENCYHPITATEVIAWAALPTVDEVKAAITAAV